MSGPLIQTPDEARARKRRNLWLAVAIAAFMLLVFAITVSRLASGQPI